MRSFQRQRQRDDHNNSGTTIGNWVRGWIQETWSLERIPISGGYIQMALEMFDCGGPSLMGEEEFLRLPPQLHRVVSSFIHGIVACPKGFMPTLCVTTGTIPWLIFQRRRQPKVDIGTTICELNTWPVMILSSYKGT
jgi:hypothetical protein